MGRTSKLVTMRTVSWALPLVLATVASAANAPKVQVSVFEESLCPACIGFFTFNPKGVWGAYKAVGDIMDLTMVYWGNAQGNASNPTRQHGPVECMGNRILECSLNLFNDTAVSLPYVECIDDTFVQTFPAGLPPGTVNASFMMSTAQQCANRLGLDWSLIDACRTGPQGTKFIQAAKDATPDHDAVPFSVINGVKSIPPPQDLIAYVCEQYTGTDKPAACSSGAHKDFVSTYGSRCVKEEY